MANVLPPFLDLLAVAGPVAAFLALFFVRPAWGLGFFVLARSVADVGGDVRIAALGVGINPAAALGAAVLIAFVLRARRLGKDELRLCGPFGFLVAAVLFEAVVGLITFGVGHVGETLREFLRYASIPAFFAATLTLSSSRERRILYGAILGAIALCALWGLVQSIAGAGTFEATSGVRRARGPFAFPNTLGYVALLGINLLGGELLFGAKRRSVWWGCVTGLGTLLVVLGLTASITVIALAFLAFALFLILQRKAALLVAVAVLVLAASPLLLPRLKMLAASSPSVDLADGGAQNTLTARLEIWRGLLSVARERPLWGWGLRSVPRVNPVPDEIRGVGSDPHNDLVLFLVEGGMIGLAGLIAFHMSVLGMLARCVGRVSTGPHHGRLTGLWVTYACMLAGSLGNNLMSFTALLVLFWGAAGVCVRERTDA